MPVGPWLNMRYRICSAILLLLLVPRSMPAQAAAPLRVVTVTAGVGNAMGWLGAAPCHCRPAVHRVAPIMAASSPTMRTNQSSVFAPVTASKLAMWARGQRPVVM